MGWSTVKMVVTRVESPIMGVTVILTTLVLATAGAVRVTQCVLDWRRSALPWSLHRRPTGQGMWQIVGGVRIRGVGDAMMGGVLMILSTGMGFLTVKTNPTPLTPPTICTTLEFAQEAHRTGNV